MLQKEEEEDVYSLYPMLRHGRTKFFLSDTMSSQWLVFILDKWVFFIESYHHPKLSNRRKFFGILL